MPDPTASATPPLPHVVVVGGGITGLAAAHRLSAGAAAGRLRLTLLEGTDRLGGVVQTARPEGFVIEEGPDSFLVRKPWARDLAVALGLGDELVATPPANRRSHVYHRGHLWPLPAGVNMGVPARLGPFLESRLVSPAGKLRALLDLVLPRVLPPGPGDVALGVLLRARLGREVVERLAEPLLAGIYAGSIDQTSLDATFPALRAQEAAHRSLILAARRQAARTPVPTPSTDARPAPSPVFLTLRGGLGRLVDALATHLGGAPGVNVRLTAPVLGLEPSGRGGYTLRLADEEMHADAVVVTVPAPRAASLLRDAAPDAARELAQIAYADLALVALAYDRSEIPSLPPGSGFVVPRDADIGITACTWVSAKWPDTAPAGVALLRCYLGRAGGGVLDGDDEGLVATARQALARAMGVTAPPHLVHVVRVPAGLPQYAVHHLARIERVETSLRALPGIWVTGNAFRGVGLPDCIRQGSEAADAVLASTAPA